MSERRKIPWTKGPWRVDGRQDDDSGDIYWPVHTAKDYTFVVNAYSEANARLIAAAPEMADLLRIIVDACFADHDFPQIVPMVKVEEARDLLARIEGAP